MSFQFVAFEPPLGTYWEESLQLLEDDDTTPIALTGYGARMMIRDSKVIRPAPTTGVFPPPLIELYTNGLYTAPPSWPKAEGPAALTAQPSWSGLFVDQNAINVATAGTIYIALSPRLLGYLSPNNVKRKLYYDLEIAKPRTGMTVPTEQVPITSWSDSFYTQPVVSGVILAGGRRTV
jgi:hypothetical protein